VCLITLVWQTHPRFPLILVANRDEFFDRPTEAAHWWPAPAHWLAGRDLEAGGTWLGLTRAGRFAALTNYRDPALNREGRRSRGELVVDALAAPTTEAWLDTLAQSAAQFNPFNLLVGGPEALFVFESTTGRARPVSPGVHGLSNHLFDSPWPKLEHARTLMSNALHEVETADALLGLLRDARPAPDAQLPHTGVPLAWERMLSSCFIRAPGYGTRSTSVILIAADGQCQFAEQTWNEDGEAAGRVSECFLLSSAP